MKKLIGITLLGLGLSLLTLRGCEGAMTNWRGRNAVRTAEFDAQRMQIDADALIYYEKLNAEAILLRAQSEAEAEVILAQGIAEAMKIIEENITSDYLKHMFIRALAESDHVIYVPTEAGLPIFMGSAQLGGY